MKQILVLSVLVGILMLTGCTLGSGIPATESVSSIGTEAANVLPPEVAVQVQNQVSQALGVQIDQLKIETVEEKEWSDSCLGLGQPNESCAQVVTPGWLVVFNVAGTEYRYRINETGTVVRQEP